MTKPQLIAMGPGVHNENIEQSFLRVMEGATWKKQRIVVITPSAYDIPAKVAFAHMALAFPPNQPVYRVLALGQEVGDAYNNAIDEILAHPELSQWEYILTIEHDNIPPWDGALKLIKQMDAHPELACIGGLYWTKGEGGVPQIWGDPADPALNFRPQPPREGLVECCGTGMGFNLWRMSMFKDARLRRPWFKTLCGEGGIGTQDLYAWTNFREFGYRCAIDCDIRVGHYDKAADIVW